MRLRRRTFLIFLAGVGLSPVLLHAEPQTTRLYLPLVQQLARFYPPEDASYEVEVARLINVERTKRGLSQLTFDVQLVQAARRQSADLAAHSMRGHTGSDGSTPTERLQAAGYSGAFGGEVATYGWSTPKEVVAAWMNSAEHRAILMTSNLSDVGVGFSQNLQSSFWPRYWIADFGVHR